MSKCFYQYGCCHDLGFTLHLVFKSVTVCVLNSNPSTIFPQVSTLNHPSSLKPECAGLEMASLLFYPYTLTRRIFFPFFITLKPRAE